MLLEKEVEILEEREVKTSELIFQDEKGKVLPQGNLAVLAKHSNGLKYLLEHETAILAKTDEGLFVLDKKGNKLTLPKDNFYVVEQLSLFD